MTPNDLVSQAGGRRRPGPAAHSPPRGAGDRPSVHTVGASAELRRIAAAAAAAAADLVVTGAPAARAAHAKRLIRQRSDVTPLGRARSAPRSHCSGDSRSAHSPLAAPPDSGPLPAPRPAPAQAAQVSPGEPLRSSKGHCCQTARLTVGGF